VPGARCQVPVPVEGRGTRRGCHLIKNRWDHFQGKEWSKEQRGQTRKMYTFASLAAFASVGLKVVDEPFDPDSIDPTFQRGLTREIKAGHEVMRWKLKFRGEQSNTCWNVDLVGGSYGFDGAVQGLFVHDVE
jgi:hypothetical protein